MMRIKWAFLVLIAVFLVACNKKEELRCDIPSVNSVNNQTASKSDNLNVAIYLDGSGSMLGYVKDGETNYTKALKSLRTVFELTGKLPVEYYRIANPMQKITSSEYYSFGATSVFYDGSNAKFKAVSSPIDAAIIPSVKNQPKMTVIITDLEQNSGDVTKLNKKIQDIYFNSDKKDYAVGIWAVKSEFNGKVYIEKNNQLQTFDYNSGKQPEKLRPFYVLFIGPYQDVKYYFGELQKYNSNQSLANSDISKLMIFHPDHIIEQVSKLETLPTTPKGITRTLSLVKDGVAASKVNQGNYELLQIDSRQQDSLTINYSVDIAPSEYSLFVDPNSLKAQVKAEKFDKFAKNFTAVDAISAVNSPIEFKDWQIIPQENKLNFTAVIQPHKFPEPGIYKLQFDILTENLQIPTWWKEWDWQTRSNEQDGSKTHNLEEFFMALKIRTETMKAERAKNTDDKNQTSQWLVGRLCYGIQKN
ncbi:hypothetical protein SR1949_03260 [Sphaerospermopsis reniformis]|uniref:Uncharacterized protein n=1 Tax=Sphaerospermopsis reniformis TaxID=531300 RepID=A0A479ZZG0_9CYAN|nr:hypothetical protein [Sphaerospermopsis reniformis]GCL35234.1 hypothetical protein SR1949_03260 [Sphaerospermopsis reniformis]